MSVGTTPDAVAVTPDQTTVLVTDEGDNMVRILHVNQPPAIVVPGHADRAGQRQLERS